MRSMKKENEREEGRKVYGDVYFFPFVGGALDKICLGIRFQGILRLT